MKNKKTIFVFIIILLQVALGLTNYFNKKSLLELEDVYKLEIYNPSLYKKVN